jgi:hypothetical protein
MADAAQTYDEPTAARSSRAMPGHELMPLFFRTGPIGS